MNMKSKKESVNVLETVLFTNIVEQNIKSKSPLVYWELLDLIAFEHNLTASFTKNFMKGCIFDIQKAQEILVKSVKFN